LGVDESSDMQAIYRKPRNLRVQRVSRRPATRVEPSGL